MEDLAIKLIDIVKLIPDIGILLAAIKIFLTARHDSKMLKEIISADDNQIKALNSAIGDFQNQIMLQTKNMFKRYIEESNITIDKLTEQIKKLTIELEQLQKNIYLPQMEEPVEEDIPEEVEDESAND